MRRLLILSISLFILLGLCISDAKATGAISPWLENGQKYIRIPVLSDGIHKLNRGVINSFASANGENLSGIASQKFALFHRGVEIPMIEEGNDLFFIGRRNNGDLDSLFYEDNKLTHPNLNIWSDTSFYFLTWYTDSRIGKRDSLISGVSSSNTQDYYIKERKENYIIRYYYGQNYYPGGGPILRLGSYQPGEGWTGWQFNSQNSFLVDSLFNLHPSSGVKPYVKIYYTTFGFQQNDIQVSIGKNSSRVWKASTQRFGVGSGVIEGEIEFSDVEGDSVWFDVVLNAGVVAINFIEIDYPKTMVFDSKIEERVVFPSSIGSDIRFLPQNFNTGSDPSRVFCLKEKNDRELNSYPVQFNSGLNRMEFQVDGLTGEENIWVANFDSLPSPIGFSWVVPRDLSQINPDYIVLTHRKLLEPCSTFTDYRSSNLGGGRNVLLIDFEEVRNQFSYGEFTSLGIRELLRYYYDDSLNPDLSLFIVGKGTVPEMRFAGKYIRFFPNLSPVENLIPTWGVPGSDLPISVGFDPQNPTLPTVPVGRISVRDTATARAYFEKIINYERPENKGLWRKDLLHLSGGTSENEISQFFNYVEDFRSVAEGPFMGATVKTFTKKFTNSIENIVIDSLVNKGLSMVTLYGHSSVNFSDIQIGEVNDPNLNYNNRDGKLPLFVINGCYSGRVFESFDTWVENWALEPERGAIGVISQTDQGYSPILKYYTEEFYRTLFAEEQNFGSTIGGAQIKTIEKLSQRFGTGNNFIRAQNELMYLQGDPVVRLNYSGGRPDYAIEEGIKAQGINGTNISSESDSFYLYIPVANLGLTSSESFRLKIDRLEPFVQDLGSKDYGSVSYLDTVRFTIFSEGSVLDQAGRNRFRMQIDPGNPKNELDTLNNIKEFEMSIPWQGVNILEPLNFSLIGQKKTNLLLASYADFSGSQVLVEYDTSYLFDSPGKVSSSLSPESNLVLQEIDLNNLIVGLDTTVFYLRAKELSDTVWDEISFTFRDQSQNGWSQSEFGQMIKNQITGSLYPDSSVREFFFRNYSSKLDLLLAGDGIANASDTSNLKIEGNWIMLKSALQEKDCRMDRLHIVRISSVNGLPIRNLSFNDPRSCGVAPMAVKSFSQLDLQDTILSSYLDGISNEEFVLGYVMGQLSFDQFSDESYASLQEMGLDSVLLMNYDFGAPLAFIGKRGISTQDFILLTADSSLTIPLDSQILELNHSFPLSNDRGGLISSLVGPSVQWEELSFDFSSNDPDDQISTSLFGIDQEGKTQYLEDVNPGITNLTHIKSDSFPYLFMETRTIDTIGKDASKLDYWEIKFASPPDGFLVNETGDGLELNEGEEYQAGFFFVNHTGREFPDSLLVRTTLNGSQVVSEFKIGSPGVFDTCYFNISINSSGLEGIQELNVFVNPYEDPETTYLNNFSDISFSTISDRTPPTLKVFVDGYQLHNGDIVSNSPDFKVELDDENVHFSISDTSLLFFYVAKVEGFDEFEIIPQKGELNYGFDSSENRLSLNFSPSVLESGEYILLANGRDVKGNRAGFTSYQIRFEVNSYRGVTDFEFFPNPFSSRLNMDFFLSGNSLPESFEIHIYNRQGREVMELDISSRIKLGFNRIYDIWDGKDQEGLELQGGLYFVRLLSKNGGSELPVSGKDSGLLKHGFSKLIYLPGQ